MNPLNALQGVFQSPTLHAAAWGFVSTFLLCVLMVITKRWHGALTMDFTDGVQKFHTAPTPRVGGVPIVLGLIVAWAKTPPDVKEMLTRLMVALLYLKHAFNESDEDVIQRWGETPTWQYFSGNDYFEHQWPCDPRAAIPTNLA